jgi:hypothetical protein
VVVRDLAVGCTRLDSDQSSCDQKETFTSFIQVETFDTIKFAEHQFWTFKTTHNAAAFDDDGQHQQANQSSQNRRADEITWVEWVEDVHE